MKKFVLLLSLAALILVSCESNEDKVNKLIRAELFKSLYDFHSYEPISTMIDEVPYKSEYDKTCIELAKKVQYYDKVVDGYDRDKDIELGARALIIADTLYYNNTSYGYLVTQRYRCKNKIGVYSIYTSKYFINSELDNIIWDYMYEEEDQIPVIMAQFKEVKDRILKDRDFYNNSKSIGEEFLSKNRLNAEVKTTTSGLQYKVIIAGKGKQPLMSDTVQVHYSGRLLNDSTFIFTYGIMYDMFKIEELPLRGLQEALTLMNEGARWEVYIPYTLGYGSTRMDKMCIIPPYSTLIFEIDLMQIGKGNNKYYSGDYKSWGLAD